MDVRNATSRAPTSPAYFDERWARGDDPWEHATRWYETRKYRLTADALPLPHYRRCFEPASGAGVLTELLATRADELVAMERHPHGVAATRRRCGSLPNVFVDEGTIPRDWPEGEFDLIVLSEVLYYLGDAELRQTIQQVGECLLPDGHVVAVHYRPDVDAHTWNGDEVHDRLLSQPGWIPTTSVVDDGFRLDVFAPNRSGHGG